MAAVTGTSPL